MRTLIAGIALVMITLVPAWAESPAPAETASRITLPLDGSPSIGPVGAPVTIVEFIDYQ